MHPTRMAKIRDFFPPSSARYNITVENPLGVCRSVIAVKLDGEMLTGTQKTLIPLADDGVQHSVKVVLG
jgi:hypothetical protein